MLPNVMFFFFLEQSGPRDVLAKFCQTVVQGLAARLGWPAGAAPGLVVDGGEEAGLASAEAGANFAGPGEGGRVLRRETVLLPVQCIRCSTMFTKYDFLAYKSN